MEPRQARRWLQGKLGRVRITVTEVGWDGSIKRRAADTSGLTHVRRWEDLIEQVLAVPPPYRATPGSPVYVIHAGDRAVLVGEENLIGSLQELVTTILEAGDPALAALRPVPVSHARLLLGLLLHRDHLAPGSAIMGQLTGDRLRPLKARSYFLLKPLPPGLFPCHGLPPHRGVRTGGCCDPASGGRTGREPGRCPRSPGLGLGVIAVEVGQIRQADRQGRCRAVRRMYKNIARGRRFRSAADRWRVVSASAMPLIRLCRDQPRRGGD